MPRLTPITSIDQIAPEYHEDFRSVTGSRGRINAPQSMIFYSPGLGSRSTELNDHLRRSLSEYDYEVAVLVAAREFPIEFVWAAHTAAARKAGVSDELIEAIRTEGPLDDASKRDQIVVTMGREIVGQRRLSQDTFDAACTELGEKALIETMMTMGYYLMIGCVLIGCDMEPRAGAPALPNLPA